MFTVKVPATTANLGPGFDVFGLALNIFDEYFFTLKESGFTYKLIGVDANKYGIGSDTNNIVYQAFCSFFQKTGEEIPGVLITCKSNIPICRGLGSSAAAIVAGLIGAFKISNKPLKIGEIINLATQLEGHPDNVTPAVLGGLTISLLSDKGMVLYQKYEINDEDLRCVLVIPDFTVETKLARSVLPETIPFSAAIYNLGRASLLASSLTERKYAFLTEIMEDKLHQPYRKNLIPGFDLVKREGLKFGAYGVSISGAGPTLLAFAPGKVAEDVGQAMVHAFHQHNISATFLIAGVYNQQIV